MELDALVAELRGALDAFDQEVAWHLETEGERADLWEEIDVPVASVRALLDALEAERSKRVRLEEALKFYAKASNWRDGILLEHIPSSVEADGGQRARSALSHSSSKGESRE